MTLLFGDFIHFAKFVHIELPNKGSNLFMAVKQREHLFLHYFWVFDHDLHTVSTPTNTIRIFNFLKISMNLHLIYGKA